MSRQAAGPPQAGKFISSRLAKALSLSSATPSGTEVREAFGIDQRPERLLRHLERFPDSVGTAIVPVWQSGEVTSPYQLAFAEMAHVDQMVTRQLRDGLTRLQTPEAWYSSLQALQRLYPDVPVLWNLEITWHRNRGDNEAWRRCSEETLTRFPGYLFAACSLASYYLGRNLPDKIPEIFEGHYELPDYDPGERVFEAAEIAAFYGTMAWYHLFKRRILRTCLCMSLINASKPADPFLDTLTYWLLLLPEKTLVALQRTLRSR